MNEFIFPKYWRPWELTFRKSARPSSSIVDGSRCPSTAPSTHVHPCRSHHYTANAYSHSGLRYWPEFLKEISQLTGWLQPVGMVFWSTQYVGVGKYKTKIWMASFSLKKKWSGNSGYNWLPLRKWLAALKRTLSLCSDRPHPTDWHRQPYFETVSFLLCILKA